jgi:acyl carrier protein
MILTDRDLLMSEEIREFIQNDLLLLDNSIINLDDNLFEFGLDSLKMMKLINFLEDKFQLTIPYDKVNPTQLKSINAITNLIEQIKS